MSNRCLIENR